MRLDIFLVEQGYFTTRNKAQEAIKNKNVKVNNKLATKASFSIDEADCVIEIINECPYVCRSAYKLLDAIEKFNINVKDKVVLDIGASTGGFSDVCLQNNAKKVYAYDVGHDQLDSKIKNNNKVVCKEGINCRYLTKDDFNDHIDFVCMDVSFISIEKITTNLLENVLEKPFEAVFLIKPQFEVGKKYLNKKGIVKDKKVHEQLLMEYIDYFNKMQVSIKGLKRSSVVGKDGNQEYLIYIDSKEKNNAIIDVKEVVRG